MYQFKTVAACFVLIAVVFVAPLNHTAKAAFLPGQFATYAQQSWGSSNTPASQLLDAAVPTLYPNGVEVGIPGAGGSSALFTTVDAILAYLPQSDEPAPLDNDYLDPPATLSGRFGSYVLALKLNVDFTDARLLAGTGALLFGDLLLADTAFPLFNGSTVREYLGEVNGFLGGAPAPYAYDDIASLTDNLSLAFEGGTPTPFAEDHLEVDRPAVLPEPSTIPLLLLAATMLLVHRRSSAPTEAV